MLRYLGVLLVGLIAGFCAEVWFGHADCATFAKYLTEVHHESARDAAREAARVCKEECDKARATPIRPHHHDL